MLHWVAWIWGSDMRRMATDVEKREVMGIVHGI